MGIEYVRTILKGIGLVILFMIQFFFSFDHTLQLVPKYKEAWNNKGWALMNLERY